MVVRGHPLQTDRSESSAPHPGQKASVQSSIAGRSEEVEAQALSPGQLLGRSDSCASAGTQNPGTRDWSGKNLVNADLAGQNLAGANLSGADLSRANLRGTMLLGANLQGATLFEAQCQQAELGGANLAGANCIRADFEGASLGHAILDGANLEDANLTEASLVSAQASDTSFGVATLRGARLNGANLRGSSFVRADCAGAHFDEAHVRAADYSESKLQSASLRHLRGYQRAQWIGVDLREVDFTGAYLLRRFVADQNYLFEFKHQSRWHACAYWIWWLTSDCGRSMLRWGLFTGVLVLAFAGIYTQVAVDYGEHATPFSPLYFSLVTMTTLGYGDVLPASTTAQVVTMFEVSAGYLMLGGLVSILSSKFARRAE